MERHPPQAKTTASRLKSLVLHLQKRHGRAEADALLKGLRVERDFLEDETRLIPASLWHQGLVHVASRFGQDEITSSAPSVIDGENLGVWSRVLRGANEPVEALQQLSLLGGEAGPTERWHFKERQRNVFELWGPSMSEALESDGLCNLARMAELAAVPMLFGGPRARVTLLEPPTGSEYLFSVRLRGLPLLAPIAVGLSSGLVLFVTMLVVGHASHAPEMSYTSFAVGIVAAWLWRRQIEKGRAMQSQWVRIQALERTQALRDARERRAAPFREGAIVGGHYRLGESLGSGGSGSIWEAERLSDGATVALKLLRTAVAHDGVAAARLRREAAALGLTWHPNVVEVFDEGILDDGTCYLVMERLYGESLLARLRRQGTLTPEELMPIALQVCDALGAVHAAGIVHRDVKPSNILLAEPSQDLEGSPAKVSLSSSAEQERVKLLDFGVAQVEWAETRLTNSGTALGTPGYMSPEQEQGLEIDLRSDLFSLGAVFYECLTGKLSSPGLDSERVSNSEVKRVLSEVDSGWRKIVRRTMAPYARDRFADAKAVKEALLRLQLNSAQGERRTTT